MEAGAAVMIQGIDAEMAVIGCMVIDPDLRPKIIDKLAPEMFEHPKLHKIFETATDLYWSSQQITYTALADKLPSYREDLIKMSQRVETLSACDQYIQIVIDRWRIRTMKNALKNILAQADFKTADESVELMRTLVGKQDEIAKMDSDASASFAEAAQKFTDWLKSNDAQNTIKTGFRSMDSARSSIREAMRCMAAGSPERIGSSSVPWGNALRFTAFFAVAIWAEMSARRASETSIRFSLRATGKRAGPVMNQFMQRPSAAQYLAVIST